jgi:hypothetical protein
MPMNFEFYSIIVNPQGRERSCAVDRKNSSFLQRPHDLPGRVGSGLKCPGSPYPHAQAIGARGGSVRLVGTCMLRQPVFDHAADHLRTGGKSVLLFSDFIYLIDKILRHSDHYRLGFRSFWPTAN